MIEIRHLKKEYDMSTPLIDVNTTINKGDIIAVIGPSGTGKSTLLRCINLLESPTSGQIFVDGEEITSPKCNLSGIRHKIGMVFQSFNLYEHLTVVENCMLAQTILLKRTPKEAYNKSMELLASVGMEAAAFKYPSNLSGGQKQRAAIARTLSTFCIQLPQAKKFFMSAYEGDVTSLILETSVVGYITAIDLTKMSDIVRARTYEPFFPLIATALIYFLLIWLITMLVRQMFVLLENVGRMSKSSLEKMRDE